MNKGHITVISYVTWLNVNGTKHAVKEQNVPSQLLNKLRRENTQRSWLKDTTSESKWLNHSTSRLCTRKAHHSSYSRSWLSSWGWTWIHSIFWSSSISPKSLIWCHFILVTTISLSFLLWYRSKCHCLANNIRWLKGMTLWPKIDCCFKGARPMPTNITSFAKDT